MSEPKKYYFVVRENDHFHKAPTHPHVTFEQAVEEASRLADENPNVEFFVGELQYGPALMVEQKPKVLKMDFSEEMTEAEESVEVENTVDSSTEETVTTPEEDLEVNQS